MLKCCSLLGICLVVMLAIDFLNYFIVNKYAPDTTGTFVYFSQTDGGYGRYGVGMTFILGLLFAAKFVVLVLFLRSLLRSLIKSFLQIQRATKKCVELLWLL